jgi:putative transcriptional regulator
MTTKQKRHLFEELKQGIKEVKAHRQGKITLHTYVVEKKPRPKVSSVFIKRLREHLHMSRSVFAIKLRVSLRTLEKWEHGETAPNDQAAALLLMVKKYPDTLKRLEKI